MISDHELYSVEINKSILSNKYEAYEVLKDIDSSISCEVYNNAVEDLDHELSIIKGINKELKNEKDKLHNMLKDVHEEYNQEINNNYGHKLNQGTDVEIKNLNTNIDKVNDYKKDNLSLTKNTQVRSNKIKMTRFAEDYDS